MFSVLNSHGVLGLWDSCLVPDCHYGVTIIPHVLIQKQPISEAFDITTSANKQEVEMLPHMAEGCLGVLIYNSTVWAEASCLCFPPMVMDCLTRHPCWWKFSSRNSWSIPTCIVGGTMAVKLGGSAVAKADKTIGRYFFRLSGVYNGTQFASVVNWLGEHSARRLPSWRMGNQCSIITSDGSDSDVADQSVKSSEVLISSS